MADDPNRSGDPYAGAPPVSYVQLTQARVPLGDADEAFATPDAAGRLPIVLLTGERSRVRNELVVAGVIVIVVGLILDFALTLRAGAVGLGGVLIVLGVFRSFIVAVPEGSRALLLRRGKFWKILEAGTVTLPPWIVVSHLVASREIPFDVPAVSVPTSDGVRIDLDVLFTFTIERADLFVFNISAPDFDQVCQAAGQNAVRQLVRGTASISVLDLAGEESDQIRDAIAADLVQYGVVVRKVVVIVVQPPQAYMQSLEGRRLAVVQRDEQVERHALEERRQADRESLERQRLLAEREHLELEAANESLRLQRLQERVKAFPDAARYDVDSSRLEVARALAGNSRTSLYVGDGGNLGDSNRLADSLVAAEMAASGGASEGQTAAPEGPPVGSGRSTTRSRARPPSG